MKLVMYGAAVACSAVLILMFAVSFNFWVDGWRLFGGLCAIGTAGLAVVVAGALWELNGLD